MLSIRNLSVRFGEFTAVDNLSLTLNVGEIFGFLGPNGAGKTTTIAVLTGQRVPSSGTIKVDQHDLVDEFERIKPLFGYVPDYDNHFEQFTAEENLRFFCGLYRIPPTRIPEVLRSVELEQERELAVQHYSKGMKKKLLIAREMLHEPRLLYLDEPTANLDLHSVQNIRNQLRQLRSRGTTVFLTTHNMEEAEELCDRIAIIDRGAIVEVDTPANFKARHGENILDVVYRTGTRDKQIEIRMEDENDRIELGRMIQAGSIHSIHSREFNFRHVFLKLTGRAFN